MYNHPEIPEFTYKLRNKRDRGEVMLPVERYILNHWVMFTHGSSGRINIPTDPHTLDCYNNAINNHVKNVRQALFQCRLEE